MTIRTINGFQIYAVTRNEVEYKPSYFHQQAEKWVEGAKRDQLSEEELDALKKKYNSRNMSREETVALLGELVEAGIMTRSTARDIYCGAVPLDVSKINPTKTQGTLTKSSASMNSGLNLPGALGGLGAMFGTCGLSAYKNWYEYAKSSTDVDVSQSAYFQDCNKYLEILEQLSA